jgi:predicted DNA binding CopG/RHH family protein
LIQQQLLLKENERRIMKSKKKLPDFKKMTESEEQEFWDKNSIIDHDDEIKEVELNFIDQRPHKNTTINLRIDEKLKTQIKKLAIKKGLPYQTLIYMWLKEHIDNEGKAA